MSRSVLQDLFLPHALLLTVVLDCDKLVLVKALPGNCRGATWLPCAGDAFTVLLSTKKTVYILTVKAILFLYICKLNPLNIYISPALWYVSYEPSLSARDRHLEAYCLKQIRGSFL